jgi:hypothetical protein
LEFAVLMTEQKVTQISAPDAEKSPAFAFILPDLHRGTPVWRASFRRTAAANGSLCRMRQMSEDTTIRDLLDAAAMWIRRQLEESDDDET